jgi:hypothetical protein
LQGIVPVGKNQRPADYLVPVEEARFFGSLACNKPDESGASFCMGSRVTTKRLAPGNAFFASQLA